MKTISSREVYRNRWTRVREEVFEYPDGTRGLYGIVDKDPAAIVIAMEGTGEEETICLVQQFRYTVGGTYFEMPQGGWEEADVDPEQMARGELREETGIRAERMTLLGKLWIGYGVMNQLHYTYLAQGLVQGEPQREPEERGMTVHRVPVVDFERMLLDGRVMDNCTAAAWGLYLVWKRRGELGPSQ